ncbi:HepT-like ribonuclease domain-containing protein [Cupriavidus necator]
MSRDQQRLTDYLAHILEAIERIGRYTEDLDEVAFLGNEMAQDAVIRNLEIIGEASHNIEGHYPDFAAAHPELPLAFAYQMRNAVAHGYFKVDLEIVWKTLQNDLPGLYQQVQAVRHALAQGGEAR